MDLHPGHCKRFCRHTASVRLIVLTSNPKVTGSFDADHRMNMLLALNKVSSGCLSIPGYSTLSLIYITIPVIFIPNSGAVSRPANSI